MRTPRRLVPIQDAVRQEEGRDWVYGYWDRDRRPLYVGLAFDVRKRAQEHARSSRWWRFVDVGGASSIGAERARDIEETLILKVKPLFNIKNSRLPWSYTIEYLAKRDAWDLIDYYVDFYELDQD